MYNFVVSLGSTDGQSSFTVSISIVYGSFILVGLPFIIDYIYKQCATNEEIIINTFFKNIHYFLVDARVIDKSFKNRFPMI